jgi:hypothetical protein
MHRRKAPVLAFCLLIVVCLSFPSPLSAGQLSGRVFKDSATYGDALVGVKCGDQPNSPQSQGPTNGNGFYSLFVNFSGFCDIWVDNPEDDNLVIREFISAGAERIDLTIRDGRLERSR